MVKVLDLYCGGGGAGMGWHLGGCEVVGVDNVPQDSYPFEFVQADALLVLTDLDFVRTFDLIHASPPCQWSTNLNRGTNLHTRRHLHTNLIPATRELLKLTGVPWVIENVQGATVRRDLTLCGEMFGLDVIRHRYFEVAGFTVVEPAHRPHRGRVRGWRHGRFHDGPYVAVYGDGGGKGSVSQWQKAMGIDWMSSRAELAEAIPPAYTEFLAEQFRASLKDVA